MLFVALTQEFIAKIRPFLVLILLSFIWGTSYILIKRGLLAYSPFQVAALRLSVSSVAFIPMLAYHFKRIEWKRWKLLILVGFAGTGLPSFLFPIAQTQLNSSLAGILNSLTPLFTLVIGIFIFRASLSVSKILGILLGLLGAFFLIFFGNEDRIGGNIWYGLYIVLATICYGTSSNLVGFYLREMKSVIISAVSFIMIGIPAMIYLFSTNFLEVLQTHPEGLSSFGYVVILALFSTVLASIIFFQLIQWTTPVFASTISYLVPIVAICWGVFDGEPLLVNHFFGMALIFAGVYLSRKK